jgi:hypothetical protein
MWAFGLWRLEGGAFSGVRLETGKGKRIRRSEGEEKKLCKILESKLDYWL